MGLKEILSRGSDVLVPVLYLLLSYGVIMGVEDSELGAHTSGP